VRWSRGARRGGSRAGRTHDGTTDVVRVPKRMIRSRLRGGISTPRDNVNDGGRWSCALQMSHAVVVRAAGCPAVVRHDRAAGRPSCHVVRERPQQTRFVSTVPIHSNNIITVVTTKTFDDETCPRTGCGVVAGAGFRIFVARATRQTVVALLDA